MNILFTICARAGSKGVKGKNIKSFCGKPIVYYTLAVYELFKQVYGSQYNIIKLAINTDSKVLIEQIDNYNIEYISIQRTPTLAGDLVAKIDVIRDTLKKSEETTACTFDIIIDLDLTSPLRTVEDIKGTLDCLQNDRNADMAFSVTPSRRSPYFNIVSKKEDGYYHTVIKSNYVARQQAPACYDMNASIYAYVRRYLLKDVSIDRKAVVWNMKDTGVLDIDSQDDLELMEVIGGYFFSKKDIYSELLHWINEKI